MTIMNKRGARFVPFLGFRFVIGKRYGCTPSSYTCTAVFGPVVVGRKDPLTARK